MVAMPSRGAAALVLSGDIFKVGHVKNAAVTGLPAQNVSLVQLAVENVPWRRCEAAASFLGVHGLHCQASPAHAASVSFVPQGARAQHLYTLGGHAKGGSDFARPYGYRRAAAVDFSQPAVRRRGKCSFFVLDALNTAAQTASRGAHTMGAVSDQAATTYQSGQQVVDTMQNPTPMGPADMPIDQPNQMPTFGMQGRT